MTESLAERWGLTKSEIVPSKSGAPTLSLEGKAVLSLYDPRKEAARLAASSEAPRVHLVGLGLGYLACALGSRLESVLALEGETERLISAGISEPDDPAHGSEIDKVLSKIRTFSDIKSLDRAVLIAASSGNALMIDSSLSASPTLSSRIANVVEMVDRPRAVVIHLKTAGDVLRSLAAVQAWKAANPHVEVSFVTERPYGEIVSLVHGIDRIFELEPGSESASNIPRPLIAFNLGGEKTATRLLSSLDAIYEAGYVEKEGEIILVDDRRQDGGAELRSLRNRMNRSHLAYAILGLPPRSDPPVFNAIGAVKFLPTNGKKYGVVQLGAGSGADVWAPKRLDPRVIGEALRQLGGRWIAVGSEAESDRARDAGIAGSENLCGRTSWTQLAELIAGAEIYIGHDSGPTHFAAALGVPTLALFGFTSPILNAPLGPRTLTVQADMSCAFPGCKVPCPERTCTARYTPAMIVDAVAHLKAIGTGSSGSTGSSGGGGTIQEQLATAARLRDNGMRIFYPWTEKVPAPAGSFGGGGVEDPDPLRKLLDDEPRIGAPGNIALSLLREWLETAERY